MFAKLTKRVEIDNDTFVRAMVLFETPRQFYDPARVMFTNEELVLMTKMGMDAYSAEKLRKIIAENDLADDADADLLITNSWRRSWLTKVKAADSGEFDYKIASFYDFICDFARFEPEIYSTLTRPVINAIDKWVLKMSLVRHRKMIMNRMNGVGLENSYLQSDFLTLDEALSAIEDSDDLIYLVPCDCKSTTYYHHKNTNVCLNISSRTHGTFGPNSAYSKQLGIELTKEEAIELIKKCDKEGLMHIGEYDGYCSCDAISCYPIKRAIELGARGVYPLSHWKTVFLEDKCDHCGDCTKICNFNAFAYNAYKKVTFDPDKCFGCTICASNCPRDAIKLEKIEGVPKIGNKLYPDH